MSDPPGPVPHLLTTSAAADADRAAASWPEVVLGPASLSAVELRMVVGGHGPLTVPAPAVAVAPGERLALRDAEGVLVATLQVTHAADETVTGKLTGVRLPQHPDATELRRTPQELSEELRSRGWRRIVAVLTDRPLYTADLDRLHRLLDDGPSGGADGAVVALLAGGVEATDLAHHVRIAALQAGLAALPAHRALLTVLPLSPDAPAEVRGSVARAYGLFDELLAQPVLVEPAAGSPSDNAVRTALQDGTPLPAELVPAPVAEALRRSYPSRDRQGFAVFFTGLSGSGKSTLAGLLAVRLLELTGRSVLLLDGDRVRRNLTAGLGFSRADRDINIRRIGWVAAQVTAAGGIAVCAPIAPYDDTRRAVRAMVEDQSPAAGFVLVHVATPLEECERRDRKGLYAQARAGLLPEFTGISDPYEEPADAEVVVDTIERSPEELVSQVLRHLRTAGWLPADSSQ